MKFAPVFSDHAVLQRDLPLPVWGTTTPGATVTVTLGGTSATTTATREGAWFLRLPPQSAGGPYTLVARTEQEKRELEDIWLGDVWICSGQSNMQYPLSQGDPEGLQSADATLPRIRLLTVSTPAKADPQMHVDGSWNICGPETLAGFSAVGGWFGRMLHEALEVPIGLISNAWGGTRIQAWMSREALMRDPAGRGTVRDYEKKLYGHPDAKKAPYVNIDDWFQAEGPENPENLGVKDGWHLPGFEDDAWEVMTLPCHWQAAGWENNGIFWFRHRLELPKAWRGRELVMNLGAIDKHDWTWVNGEKVGGMGWERHDAWCTPRTYTVPASATAGTNTLVIAVRVRSHIYQGGMTGPGKRMTVHPVDEESTSRSLAGEWRYAVEQNWGLVTPPPEVDVSGKGPGGQNAPYTLFHSRLAPLIPYGIRGWIWYQGESNVSEPDLYRRFLPRMVEDWRRVWGQGDLPFLQVQLANFNPPPGETPENAWAELRAAQNAARRLPGVGLAVAIDVGEAADIHPRNKKAVGARLARWALAEVYGKGGPRGGPELTGADATGNGRLRLRFREAEGLCTRDGKPVSPLAIAGMDRIYRRAESRIDGEQLEVWHPDIPQPAAVRYAWADNPEGCNLVNADDLPAIPFDTDDLITE